MTNYQKANERLFQLLRKRGGKLFHRQSWTCDSEACFSLMVKHKMQPFIGNATVSFVIGDRLIAESFTDHANADAAVRYTTVLAVIAKLEAA